jgi:hypothetical protein
MQLQRMHGLPGTAVTRTVSDTSAQSAALASGTTYLMQATQDCHVAFAVNPTATTSSTPVFAATPYLITIPEGATVYKCAAIRAETNGTLYLTPMTSIGG